MLCKSNHNTFDSQLVVIFRYVFFFFTLPNFKQAFIDFHLWFPSVSVELEGA